jgi:predicted ATPase/DNA-binding winged helix-turn-helix (wHTH) protein
MAPIRFADFRLDATERRLDKGGAPVELGARAFDLLHVLVQSAGRLVTKAELLDQVWPDVIVEEANLHVQMTALRRAVGRDAIATVPGRGYQFVLPLQAGDATPAVPVAAGSEPWPAAAALPPLLGRDDDLARIARALADPTHGGFVTVTGAGGSGKTLLARHCAARFGTVDGAAPVWVDLLELTAPEALVPAVAIAAEVQGPPRRAEELAQALADAQLLLVLDNAEHVLAAVAELAAALRREAPGVRLLVTSQAPLRCAGEVVHVLAGLSVPTGPCSAELALRHAAVALFVAHAKQADRRFRLADPGVDDVVAICTSLGGSALGVQLAAALLGQMPLAAVRARLARRETGPDAAAIDPAANVLRSALSWSHDLLSPTARQVFRRLAVAQGPLPLPLALAVAVEGADDAARDEATEALADLVDRSLVQCEAAAGGGPSYRLLEAPRALALEFLHDGGERAGALRPLGRALAPLGDALQADIYRDPSAPDRRVALSAALPVAADIVAAFEALLSIDGADAAATAIRVSGALSDQMVLQRPAAQRLRWGTALRERAAMATLPAELRARAFETAATLIRHSDLTLRLEVLLTAARLWRDLGQTFDEFRALSRGADCAALLGRHEEAAALLARVRELEDPAWPAGRRRWRWFAEGVVAVSAGDLPRAMHAWRQQLELTRGSDSNRLQALHSLANAEQIGGDAAAALPRLREAVDIARRIRMRATLHAYLLPNRIAAQVALGDLAAAREAAAEGWPHARAQDAEAWWADHLALLAARDGRPHTAARLLGYSDAAYARLNDSRQALEAQAAAAAECTACAALGVGVFAVLRAEGSEPTAAERVFAAALARDDSGPPLSTGLGAVAAP